jgi:hypothetical protein
MGPARADVLSQRIFSLGPTSEVPGSIAAAAPLSECRDKGRDANFPLPTNRVGVRATRWQKRPSQHALALPRNAQQRCRRISKPAGTCQVRFPLASSWKPPHKDAVCFCCLHTRALRPVLGTRRLEGQIIILMMCRAASRVRRGIIRDEVAGRGGPTASRWGCMCLYHLVGKREGWTTDMHVFAYRQSGWHSGRVLRRGSDMSKCEGPRRGSGQTH